MGDFDPYASMAEWQRGVVEPFAEMSGIPPGTVLFAFALWTSLPLGALFQLIPSSWTTLKNVYSFVSGAHFPRPRRIPNAVSSHRSNTTRTYGA